MQFFKVIGMFSFGVKWLGVGALGLDPRKVNQGVKASTNRLVGPECSRSIGFEKVWFLNELHRLAWFKQMWYVWEQVMTFKYIYIYTEVDTFIYMIGDRKMSKVVASCCWHAKQNYVSYMFHIHAL